MTTTTVQEPDAEARLEPLEELTGHDRCDRCGAQAYVRVELYSGLDLLFCIHHYNANEMALEQKTLRLQDERSKLLDSGAAPAVD